MILRIFLFLLYTVLVSSNNGSPVIPAQTYPYYQQNVYPNQPSEITPYSQSTMVQNQPNLSPSNIRQMLINKLLSNSGQTNFDPNAGGYGSNLVGYSSNQMAANTGNVYYGAPVAENYQMPSTKIAETPKEPKTEVKRKKHKRRRSKSRRRHDEATNINESVEKVDNTEKADAELPKKPKRRSRKRNNDTPTQDISITEAENETRKPSRTKKRKNKENETVSNADEETKVENPRPRRRRKKKPKSNSNDDDKVTSDKIPEQATPSKASKVKQEDLNIEKEGFTEENRVARNSKPETNELSKLIPNLPEGFASPFNFNGLPQFQNNPAMSSFFANYENIYQSLIAKNQEPASVKRTNKLPANKTRPQQKRKPVVKSKNSTVTEASRSANSSTHAVTPKVNVVPKNKTIYIDGIKRPNNDSMPKNESSKSNGEPCQVETVTDEILKNDDIVDKNKEMVIENDNIEDENDGENFDSDLPLDPDYSKGYIADYYPHFADSMVNTANNKEVYIKNLGDTKYYYAVDKGNDLIGRMRFESFTLPERVPKDYEKHKKYDEIELASVKNASKPIKENKEEVIQFRSPPLLETPDFQTRKVERHKINTDYYNFSDKENDDVNERYKAGKSSIYSEVKTPYYSGTNGNTIEMNNDKQKKDIETVFARSKVVKYGPVINTDDSAYEAMNSQAKNDFNDQGITYVLPSYLDEPEFFW